MPPITYAIALGLGMLSLGIALGLWAGCRSLAAARSGKTRRRVTASLAVWTLVALGLEVWVFSSPTLYPLLFASGWVLVGLLFGWALLRARRRASAPAVTSTSEAGRPAGLGAPLPPGAEEALRAGGVSPDEVLATLAADLAPDGSYAERRLAVTRERLVSLAPVDGSAGGPDSPWKITADVPIAEIEGISAESAVGGGRLAVLRAGKSGPPQIFTRYSNTHTHAYVRLAKVIGDHTALLRKRRRESEGGEPARKDGSLEGPDDAAPELSFEAPDEKDVKNCPSCGLPLDEGTKVCPRCVKRGRVLLRLLGLSAQYWVQILILGILLIAGTVLTLIEPYLVRAMVDDILSPEVLGGDRPASFIFYEGSSKTALLLLVSTLAGTMLLGLAVGVFRSRLAAEVGARVGMELKARVFHHLQTLSLAYFDRQKTGALMSRTDHDTGRLQHFLIDGVQRILINLLQMIGILVVLFALDWRLAIWALLPTPLMIAFSAFFWRFFFGMMRRLWDRVAKLSAFLNDSISGVRVVKAFGQEERERARFDEHNVNLYEGIVRVEKTFATFHPFLMLIMGSGGLLVRYVGGMGVVSEEISLGTLLAFGMYLWRFYGPLQMVSRINDWLTRSLTAAERVFEVLDTEPEVKEAEDAVPITSFEGRVELRGVTFGYDKFKPVLKNVSFEVAPGEMIGLVGHSGAGKTTTSNLICRLYDVDEGAILFDGVDVRKLKLADVRHRIGVVLQETYLFSGSIAENIAYAKPDASREEILEAAAAANAHEFIMRKPDGYDSEVGERGGQLSVGEKQRIAIARAILHNPKVLILDEATSSVDTETEKEIQAALTRLVENRTTFAIAHRLSTLRNAHRLVVFENGEIKEIGTHKELLEKGGIYSKLVKAQSDMTKSIAVGG